MSSTRVGKKESPDERVKKYQKIPGNKRCADCIEKLPQYANLTFNTFVCTTCSGIHREFSHRVKSVSLSNFSEQEADALHRGGNEACNAEYLARWSENDFPTPRPGNDSTSRDFIKAKYVEKRWLRTGGSKRGEEKDGERKHSSSRKKPAEDKKLPAKPTPPPPPPPPPKNLNTVDIFSAPPQQTAAFPPAPAAAPAPADDLLGLVFSAPQPSASPFGAPGVQLQPSFPGGNPPANSFQAAFDSNPFGAPQQNLTGFPPAQPAPQPFGAPQFPGQTSQQQQGYPAAPAPFPPQGTGMPGQEMYQQPPVNQPGFPPQGYPPHQMPSGQPNYQQPGFPPQQPGFQQAGFPGQPSQQPTYQQQGFQQAPPGQPQQIYYPTQQPPNAFGQPPPSGQAPQAHIPQQEQPAAQIGKGGFDAFDNISPPDSGRLPLSARGLQGPGHGHNVPGHGAGQPQGIVQQMGQMNINPQQGLPPQIQGVHQQAPQFMEGETVMHRDSNGQVGPARILKIHYETTPPYFSVLMLNTGTERNTDAGHLMQILGGQPQQAQPPQQPPKADPFSVLGGVAFEGAKKPLPQLPPKRNSGTDMLSMGGGDLLGMGMGQAMPTQAMPMQPAPVPMGMPMGAPAPAPAIKDDDDPFGMMMGSSMPTTQAPNPFAGAPAPVASDANPFDMF